MKIQSILGFGLLIVLVNCSVSSQSSSKINGVSFVASGDSISIKNTQPVKHLNANYAALMPFGFIRDINHPEVVYNSERQWFGETIEGVEQYIDELYSQNIAVMLKPQIWVFHGVFTGHIEMKTESDWLLFESTYRNFILDYAKLAEKKQVKLFCIGTELEQFIVNRPSFWQKLIKDVRSVYSGPLTYAANWDEYQRVPFWGDLDYIGVDAYFPISEEKTPSLNQCLEGWLTYKSELLKHSNQYNLPILFTEFGYRSVDFTAKEPWNADRMEGQINLEAQKNATEALFQSFWSESWFAGGFIWKWFIDHDNAGGPLNNRFTPQNKPVEELIKTTYAVYN